MMAPKDNDDDGKTQRLADDRMIPKLMFQRIRENVTSNEGHYTNMRFADLKDLLSPKSYNALQELKYEKVMTIQALSLASLRGLENCVITSATGSGKTVAYLLPAFETLAQLRHKPSFGTSIIVLAPTRELCMQIHDIASVFARSHSRRCALLVSGGNWNFEQKQLQRGTAIAIATPGRLLDHLQNTESFVYSMLITLIVDEADRIVSEGFKLQVEEILKYLRGHHRDDSGIQALPLPGQTVIVTATLTPEVHSMFDYLPRDKVKYFPPVCNGVSRPASTNPTLHETYCVVNESDKFVVLKNTLLANRDKKTMVFMNACKAVQFFTSLLNCLSTGCHVLSLQGKMEQKERTKVFFKFCKTPGAVLFCTDVASRGLDIQQVDLIIQYDPPTSAEDYVHRVGRTARADRRGEAILLLYPQETDFVDYLSKFGITMTISRSIDDDHSVADDIRQVQELVDKNECLREMATDAYTRSVRAYYSHPVKAVFDISKMSFNEVARSFGLRRKPDVMLNLSNLRKKRDRAVPKRFKHITPKVTRFESSDDDNDED